MNDHSIIDVLIRQLDQLAQAPGLPRRARPDAARLLARLRAPIDLLICGVGTDDAGWLAERVALALAPRDIRLRLATLAEAAEACASADIVIWQTETFDQAEARIWDQAPDMLKDHSYLVTCQTPHPSAQLLEIADLVFLSAFSVQPESAGLAALCDALKGQIDAAIAAACDHGALFVAQHEAHLTTKDPVPQPHADLAAKATGSILPDLTRCLDRAAAQLAPLAVSDDPADCALILEVCVETAQALADIFETYAPTDLSTQAYQQDVLEAADSIMLMSMEQDLISATDAVTTLLQFRKEFSTVLAA